MTVGGVAIPLHAECDLFGLVPSSEDAEMFFLLALRVGEVSTSENPES